MTGKTRNAKLTFSYNHNMTLAVWQHISNAVFNLWHTKLDACYNYDERQPYVLLTGVPTDAFVFMLGVIAGLTQSGLPMIEYYDKYGQKLN